jgi:hypothetical protein
MRSYTIGRLVIRIWKESLPFETFKYARTRGVTLGRVDLVWFY